MKKEYFSDFDFDSFWDNCDYAKEEYVGEPATEKMFKQVEKRFKFKLPESYKAFISKQNGGMPLRKTEIRTTEPTSYADDHIAITGIFGVDESKFYSLFYTEHMTTEWEYPKIGLAICDCPSAGHQMVYLDYSKCGKNGEPQVVYIDEEDDHSSLLLANTFEEFILKLEDYKPD